MRACGRRFRRDSESRACAGSRVRFLEERRRGERGAWAPPRPRRAPRRPAGQLRVSESRRTPARVLSFVRAVLRGRRGCEGVGGRRRQPISAARRREAARSRCGFKNTTRLLALAAPSQRLRSRREAGSRSRSFWTLSGHGAMVMAAMVELNERLAFSSV